MKDGSRMKLISRRTSVILAILITVVISVTGCKSNNAEVYPPGGSGDRVEFLIITKPSMLPAVETLASFKAKEGMTTAVATTEKINDGYPGVDLPERIRNCVKDYQENKGTSYLLLVGDHARVPSRYVFCPKMEAMEKAEAYEVAQSSDPYKFEQHYVPTDLYYANLVDDWDINDNQIYGEVKELSGLDRDEGGFSHQVSVGRLPARSLEDLEEAVQKIIDYNPGDKRSALFISAAKDMGERFEDEAFVDYISKLCDGWECERVSEGQPDCNVGNVLGLLSSDRFNLVVAVAHGTPFGICLKSAEMREHLMNTMNTLVQNEEGGENGSLHQMMEEYLKAWNSGSPDPAFIDDEMIGGLDNGYPFFFLGFGCYTTAYDYEPHYSILGRLVMQRGGAIAACGMTRAVDDVDRGVFEASLSGEGGLHFELGAAVLENICNGQAFGPALDDAREQYATEHQALMVETDHRITLLAMALLGDPTLKLTD